MWETLAAAVQWLLGPETAQAKAEPAQGLVELGTSALTGAKPAGGLDAPRTPSTHLWARWIFLRALGLIYFSGFYSLLFQAKGLIGPNGILPASDYLQAVAAALHGARFWFAPSLLWLGASDRALMLLCWAGMIASILLVLNIWPRGMIAICFVCFLSFVCTLQDFASYQSDGMLQEAGFISFFFAPTGFLPGLGRTDGPSRLSRFLLQWEWFRIYFQSGVVKLASGDTSWRNLTAMDDYYQNGPLPTWVGWYVQHLPRYVHASAVILTFAVELVIVWMMFLPRRFRIICFFIVTPFEIMIILTANYTFLNYLVLSLGFLLLDDQFIESVVPEKIRCAIDRAPRIAPLAAAGKLASGSWKEASRKWLMGLQMAVAGVCLGVIFYASSAQLLWMFIPEFPLPQQPIRYLEPFRLADRYGLFAVMTHARYEIEFQGSRDGKTWIAYPFRYKPQELNVAPGIYAPYQPRFEWNLWFASLGNWQQYRFVVWTEERLLRAEPDVLELFAGNPFAGGAPPTRVRAVVWQYWFTDMKTKRETGDWWRRELLGEYAPALEQEPDGKIIILNIPIAEFPSP
jgi:lipase maturation factor 1